MIRRFCSLRLVLATLLIFAASPVAVFAGDITEQTIIIEELDGLLLGVWAKLATNNNLTREHFVAAAKHCRSTRRLVKVDYQTGAKEELPAQNMRRGNVVYYRTELGLQRLDMALRQVAFIKAVSRQQLKSGAKIWTLTSPKGSLKIGFASNRNIQPGARIPILIEHNSVYLRCPKLKSG